MPPLFYLRLIAFLPLILWAIACQKPVEPSYPDNRGRKLAELPLLYTVLGWSMDSRELYYVTFIQYTTVEAGNYRLYALDVETGTSRLIYDGPGGRNIAAFRSIDNFQSPDGQYLYLLTRGRGQAGYSLSRINTRETNQAVAIDSSADLQYPTNPYTPSTTVSANGQWLGFQYRPDSSRLHNLVNHSTIRYRVSSAILLSSDASQVLFQQENGPLYRLVNVADLSECLIDIRAPAGPFVSYPPLHFPDSKLIWHPDGIRYTYGEFFGTPAAKAAIHLYVWNVMQQKSSLFWTVPDEESGASQPVWSRDGERIAFFSANNQMLYARIGNAIIYSTNVTTLKTSKVATVTFGDGDRSSIGPGAIRGLFLSPNNTNLAYYIGNTVYVAPIQP